MTVHQQTQPFYHRERLAGASRDVGLAITDSSLNLGWRTDLAELEAVLAAVRDEIGATPSLMSQVHGNQVAVLTEPSPLTALPRADALVTATPGIALAARAADCTPVLLADPGAGIVGAAHSGRPGMAAGVVPAAVEAMRELGATAITAWIGPHVCGGCYEVPAELRAEVAATVPESYAETRWGTPALDIGRGAHAQLAAGGVTDIRWIEGCTREEPRLHSYRRDGAGSGRFAGLIWLEEGR